MDTHRGATGEDEEDEDALVRLVLDAASRMRSALNRAPGILELVDLPPAASRAADAHAVHWYRYIGDVPPRLPPDPPSARPPSRSAERAPTAAAARCPQPPVGGSR